MATAYPDVEKLTLGATNVEPVNSSPSTDSTEVKGTEALNDEDYHELEILESCEAEEEAALQNWKSCDKDPGHKSFIPVKDFTKEHLPEGYRAPILLDFIMAIIGLTVKVVMRKVSCGRPDNYHLSKFRGRGVRAVGSGIINGVERKFKDPPRDGEYCPCPLCEGLPLKDRKKQWGKFIVATAKHVMFDDEESKHTLVEVDYDTDTDRDACPKLYGLEMMDDSAFVKEENVAMDECDLSVVSHDMKVCYMLDRRLERYKNLRDDLENRRFKTSKNPPLVCVSHPHGLSKHVSVGEWTGQQISFPYRWRYTTSTCPGSSGAPIFKLGLALDENVPGHLTRHSGARCKKSKVNESGRLTTWLVPDSKSLMPLEPEDRRFPAELRPPF